MLCYAVWRGVAWRGVAWSVAVNAAHARAASPTQQHPRSCVPRLVQGKRTKKLSWSCVHSGRATEEKPTPRRTDFAASRSARHADPQNKPSEHERAAQAYTYMSQPRASNQAHPPPPPCTHRQAPPRLSSKAPSTHATTTGRPRPRCRQTFPKVQTDVAAGAAAGVDEGQGSSARPGRVKGRALVIVARRARP